MFNGRRYGPLTLLGFGINMGTPLHMDELRDRLTGQQSGQLGHRAASAKAWKTFPRMEKAVLMGSHLRGRAFTGDGREPHLFFLTREQSSIPGDSVQGLPCVRL